MEAPPRHSPEGVKELVTSLGKAAGIPAEDAAILADSLVDAEVHGASTHGVSRLGIYLKRIRKGLIDPKAELKVERESGAVLCVDAGNGLGQVQAVKTFDLLTPRAREHGIAAATIRNSQHFGTLSYYCNRAAERGMILIATTTAEPAMAPAGGCDAFFGTNPIAASFPTGKGYPVKLDLATSGVARGNIIAADRKGIPIPEGWAMDPDGNPTTDAAAALAGTVLTMAGHKGYALAFLVEVLSSVLSGAAVGSSIGSMYKDFDRKQDVGHFFCLLNIESFMEMGTFKRRIDDMIDRLKGGRRRPGVEEILVPGERSFRKAEESRRLGIAIGPETLRELEGLCGELGVEFALAGARAAS